MDTSCLLVMMRSLFQVPADRISAYVSDKLDRLDAWAMLFHDDRNAPAYFYLK